MSYETIGDEPDIYDLYEGTQIYVTGVGTRYNIFICDTNPSSSAFILDQSKFVFYIDGYDFSVSNPRYKVAIFDKIAENTWNVLSSEASWRTVPRPSGGSGSVYTELSSVGLSVSSGDYIGVIIEVNNPSTGTDLCTVAIRGDSDTATVGRRYSSTSIPSSNFTTSFDDYISIFGSKLVTGGGIGGPIKYTCHNDTGVWSDEEVIPDTWGYIRPTDFELVGTFQVYCTVTPPWDTAGTYTDNVVFTDGVAKTIDNEDDEHEHWKLTFDVSTIDGGSIIEYTECWWRDNENGDVYVSEDGSDNNYGSNWDNPFASVEKGFEEVADGRNIYVESGLYSETLANLDVATGNGSCKLVPMNKDHLTNSEATVIVGTGTITGVNQLALEGGSWSIIQNSSYHVYRTLVDRNISHPTGVVQSMDIVIIASTGTTCTIDVRLIHFRPDGDTLHLIAKSDQPVRATTIGTYNPVTVKDIYCGFDLQAGDFIGVETHYISGDEAGIRWNVNHGTPYDCLYWKLPTEVTGDTSISTDWFQNDNRPLMRTRYFI